MEAKCEKIGCQGLLQNHHHLHDVRGPSACPVTLAAKECPALHNVQLQWKPKDTVPGKYHGRPGHRSAAKGQGRGPGPPVGGRGAPGLRPRGPPTPPSRPPQRLRPQTAQRRRQWPRKAAHRHCWPAGPPAGRVGRGGEEHGGHLSRWGVSHGPGRKAAAASAPAHWRMWDPVALRAHPASKHLQCLTLADPASPCIA